MFHSIPINERSILIKATDFILSAWLFLLPQFFVWMSISTSSKRAFPIVYRIPAHLCLIFRRQLVNIFFLVILWEVFFFIFKLFHNNFFCFWRLLVFTEEYEFLLAMCETALIFVRTVSAFFIPHTELCFVIHWLFFRWFLWNIFFRFFNFNWNWFRLWFLLN